MRNFIIVFLITYYGLIRLRKIQWSGNMLHMGDVRNEYRIC